MPTSIFAILALVMTALLNTAPASAVPIGTDHSIFLQFKAGGGNFFQFGFECIERKNDHSCHQGQFTVNFIRNSGNCYSEYLGTPFLNQCNGPTPYRGLLKGNQIEFALDQLKPRRLFRPHQSKFLPEGNLISQVYYPGFWPFAILGDLVGLPFEPFVYLGDIVHHRAQIRRAKRALRSFIEDGTPIESPKTFLIYTPDHGFDPRDMLEYISNVHTQLEHDLE